MYWFGDYWFNNRTEMIIFNLIFYIWVLTEMGVTFISLRGSTKKKENRKSNDRGSLLGIIFGVWICIGISFIIRYYQHWLLPDLFFGIGSLFMVLGIIIRIWSVWTLRRFFSLSVVIKSKQSIVKDGPYKYLRHPAYTGGILTLLGLPIALRSIAALVCVLLVVFVVYGYRIRIEEKTLLESFGDQYVRYSKQTKRIIPGIW